MSSGQAGYYLDLAREDYFTEGGEPPGEWHGQGASALGLEGRVGRDQLYNLFDGLSPDGSRPLVQFQRKEKNAEHLPGWDLTFSAPKSVSILWATSSPEVRADIEAIHSLAVKEALDYLERTSGLTRSGHGGESFQKAGWAVALFEHSTSRALDMDLHTHALVMNVGVRPNGRTSTLTSHRVLQQKMLAGAVYRTTLAFYLQTALKVEVEAKRTWFEVKGVPKGLIEFESKRRAAIEKVASLKGVRRGKAFALAAIETREAKGEVSRERLFETWKGDGERFGWGPAQAKALLGRYKPTRSVDAELKGLTTTALKSVTETKAHFTKQDFTRALIESSMTSAVPPGRLLDHVDTTLATSSEVVRLGARRGVARYTTEAMFNMEESLLDATQRLHSATNHPVAPDVAVRALARRGDLAEEQLKAVLHVTQKTGDLAFIEGVAGSGKTRLMGVAKEAWEASGYRVVGSAIAGKMAKRLEAETGIPSVSVTKLLSQVESHGSWREAEAKIRQANQLYGPNVMPLLRELADRYGPNIMDPIEPLLAKYTDKILKPLIEISERYTYDPLQKAREFNEKYGPNVMQAWHSLSEYLIDRLPAIGKERAPLDKKTVLVVDEGSMVDTPTMKRLAEACEDNGAKLVVLGERIQLNPIGPGAPFAELVDRHGAAKLKENHRQKEPWMKDASADIADRDARAALAAYAERGLLSVGDTSDQTKRDLISKWTKDPFGADDKLIIAGRTEDVDVLNSLAQTERLNAGELRGEALKVGERAFYERDSIVFTAPAKKIGVENGERATIDRIDDKRGRISATLDSGDKVSFSAKDYPDFALGYASTVHKAQGASVPSVYVLLGGSMQDREMSFTQITRASVQASLFVTKEEAGDDLAKIVKDMERSRQKDMAHTVLREQRRDRSIPI